MGEQPPRQIQPPRVEFVAVINSFNRRHLLQQALTSLTRALRNARFGSAIVVFDHNTARRPRLVQRRSKYRMRHRARPVPGMPLAVSL